MPSLYDTISQTAITSQLIDVISFLLLFTYRCESQYNCYRLIENRILYSVHKGERGMCI